MFKRDKAIRYQLVDVFASTPFCGNPAGVVINATPLTDVQMQQIAREINIANTAFLLPPQKDGDLKIRYFCPESEINMCGHATIGSLFVWSENNLKDISKGSNSTIKVETKIGTLSTKISCLYGDSEKIAVTLPSPQFKAADIDPKWLADALNINESEIVEQYPIQIVNSGLSFIEVGITDKENLLNVKPSFDKILNITKEMNTDSVQIFTLDTFDESSTVLSRTFFPKYGVNEDPVCGTGNAAVASYLIQNGIIRNGEERIKIIGEQGHSLSRPGMVYIEARCINNKIENVLVSGSAVLVFEGYVFQ
jgi:PhzF family phenazine biosynthesis protein